MRQQPFASPEEALKALSHHGVKGMRWGVRKEDISTGGRVAKKISSGTPEFQKVFDRVTRSDHPQVLMPPTIRSPKGKSETDQSGKINSVPQEHHGLSRNQKMLLAFGAVTAAAAGYYAYQHYSGGHMSGLDLAKIQQNEKILGEMKLPKSWDVSGLKHGPISTKPLGQLAGNNVNLKLLNPENLVVNTSRGYADILPKTGLSNPFAAEQHASAIRVLEDMRDRFPSIRNMNVEVVPMSVAPGSNRGGDNGPWMSVLSMGAGEARIMYNDTMSHGLTPETIAANRTWLPGLGAKDYIAHHEMGHLLAVAHGELPPTSALFSENSTRAAFKTWQKADPLLHRKLLSDHGFTFREAAKISRYAATEPAEAVAELVGHGLNPEMRGRLTAEQLIKVDAMINTMGGLA